MCVFTIGILKEGIEADCMEFHALCYGLRRIPYGNEVTEVELVVISLMGGKKEVWRQNMQNDRIIQRSLTRH